MKGWNGEDPYSFTKAFVLSSRFSVSIARLLVSKLPRFFDMKKKGLLTRSRSSSIRLTISVFENACSCVRFCDGPELINGLAFPNDQLRGC